MAEDRWPIQLANIIRAARDTELAMAKLQEAINRTHQRLERIRQTYAPPCPYGYDPAGNCLHHFDTDDQGRALCRAPKSESAPFIVPGGVMDKSGDAPGPAHHARHGCSVVPTWRETPLTEGDPNPVVPQSLRTVLNENDSQVQGDTP